MHRFYLPPEQCKRPSLVLTGGEAHHAVQVLRLRAGEQVIVLDGAGLECRCEIVGAQREEVVLRVVQQRRIAPLPCQTTLLQALPKGKLFESVVQKATELGVARIVPLLSERVVKQPRPEGFEPLVAKWHAVAIEAIKQCGSAWLPKVERPVTPGAFVQRKETFELPLVASLQTGTQHPRLFFERFRRQQQRPPKSVSVWIGPEGDFTGGEIDLLVAAGAQPITLGPLVLRTDTASVYCLSVVNYETQCPSSEGSSC